MARRKDPNLDRIWQLQPAQLSMLFSGIDLRSARQRKRFQRVG
jgi:hypothetical protein